MIASFYTAISGVVKAEMFPAVVRALGVGFTYAVGNAAFGGTAEYVALWFKSVGRRVVRLVCDHPGRHRSGRGRGDAGFKAEKLSRWHGRTPNLIEAEAGGGVTVSRIEIELRIGMAAPRDRPIANSMLAGINACLRHAACISRSNDGW